MDEAPKTIMTILCVRFDPVEKRRCPRVLTAEHRFPYGFSFNVPEPLNLLVVPFDFLVLKQTLKEPQPVQPIEVLLSDSCPRGASMIAECRQWFVNESYIVEVHHSDPHFHVGA